MKLSIQCKIAATILSFIIIIGLISEELPLNGIAILLVVSAVAFYYFGAKFEQHHL
jgi:hypothetical protein